MNIYGTQDVHFSKVVSKALNMEEAESLVTRQIEARRKFFRENQSQPNKGMKRPYIGSNQQEKRKRVFEGPVTTKDVARTSQAVQCPKCNKNHFGECSIGTDQCFKCGKMGHKVKNCPSLAGNQKNVVPKIFSMADDNVFEQPLVVTGNQKNVVPKIFSMADANVFEQPSVVTGESRAGTSQCFKCGKMGHKAKNCPSLVQNQKNVVSKIFLMADDNVFEQPSVVTGNQKKVVPKIFSMADANVFEQPSVVTGDCKAGSGLCFNCGKKGHIARNCPSLAENQKNVVPKIFSMADDNVFEQSSVVTGECRAGSSLCFKCGKMGHKAKNCPSLAGNILMVDDNAFEQPSVVTGMVGLSNGEKHFIQGGIAQDLRADGRKRLTYRPICVETGIIPQANGSARVRIGDTDVIASVKAELGRPSSLQPDKGKVAIYVDSSPTASPIFEGRGGNELSADLSVSLQRCLLGGKSGAGAGIDLSSLVIVEGKICWDLYIDGLVVSSDGNLLDALGAAVMAALSNAGIPRVQVSAEAAADEQPEVEISDEEFLQFDTSGVPVIVTMTKVGRHYIVDATTEEESQMSSALSISVNRKGHICGLTKRGGAGLDPSIILDMISVGKYVSDQLFNKLDSEIAAAEADDKD